MQRERVAEDIYVFISELYVEVTATVINTHAGAVLFDTLLYPEETLAIKRFVETRLKTSVRYVINSHFHADHTAGTCFFPEAQVIAHQRCADLLATRGRDSLARAKSASTELRQLEVVLPHVTFAERMTLAVGEKTLDLWEAPGHSPDGIVCLVRDERILLAGDALMSLPFFVDDSFDAIMATLTMLSTGTYETIVQGHGDIILRGEIDERLREDRRYLERLRAAVDAALVAPTSDDALAAALATIDIEACGKNRVLLGGAAERLHRQNVLALANVRRTINP